MIKKRKKKRGIQTPVKVDVVELLNLRPITEIDGSTTFRALPPAVRVADEGWEPLGAVDGQMVVANGKLLKIGVQQFTMAGAVSGAIVCGDGSLMVDAGSGNRHRLERTADCSWLDLGPEPVWNPVTITARRHSTVDFSLPAMDFDELPATGSVTDVSVLNRLAETLAGAYSVSAGVARQRGALLCPVVARATVYDNDGCVLYRGPEVVVGTEFISGVNESVSVVVGTDGRSTAEAKFELSAFRLHVKVDPMVGQGWVERAATLVVEAGPQFHPWTASAGGGRVMAATVGRGAGGTTERRLTVSMPGSAMSLSSAMSDRSVALIEAVAGNFSETSRVVARFQKPYERGIDAIITQVPYSGLKEEADELAKTVECRCGVTEADDKSWLFNSPNRFSAGLYATDGTGVVMAGDLTVSRFAGYSASELAAATDAGQSFTAMTTVVFSDGSRVSRRDAGSHDAPVKLSPLVSYPAPDATAIRVVVEYPDGSQRRWAYGLHPDPTGRLSVGVDESILPVAGAEVSENESLLSENICPLIMSRLNALAVMTTGRPGHVTAVAAAEGRIKALVGARTGGGAWEFGRSRFVVAGEGGMTLAGVSSAGDRLVLNHLNDRAVDGRYGMTAGADGTVYAVANGRVVKVAGSRTDEIDATTLRPTDMDAIAFDPTTSCLIVGSTNGSTRFHHLDVNEVNPTFTTPSLGPFGALKTIGSTVYASTESGLYAFARADAPYHESVSAISMTVRVESVDPDRALRRLSWPMGLDDFDGEMRIDRFFMSPYPEALLAGWRYTGGVHTTLRFPIVALSVRTAYATVSGTVVLGPGKNATLALPE